MLLLGDTHESLRALSGALARRAIDVRARASWGERWSRANRTSWRTIAGRLADRLASNPQLVEGHVVRGLLDRIPSGSVLAVGNSLSIRELDLFGESSTKNVRVLCQRGANGIDGLVAGAYGSATVAGAPVTLLLGDVSFLHDLNSLMLPRDLAHPFVVVVLQNQGGRIFELLPIGKVFAPGSVELKPVVTPHPFTFRAAAELFGHAYRRVETPGTFAEALDEAYARPACTIVEAVVPSDHAAERHLELWRQLGQDIDADLKAPRS
jgi:2-succinyl-5-enolpyruvyl-6-hydroxy-3-cyclohexene-1-carboxylate synthase